MKRYSAVVLLVVCLAVPAIAREERNARRDPEPSPIERVIKAIKKIAVGVLSWDLTVPKP